METNNNQRPSAALINREWFECAAGIMPQEDLAMVVLNACRYVFGLPAVSMRNQSQHIVFAMVKPALDSDLAKYRERCARNATNARAKRDRVGASGSEWERVGATTTPTPTPTPTPTQISLPREDDKSRRDREQFFITLYFAEQGSEAPIQEMRAFWNYYESLGWKNNKGAAIVRKQSAAAMWRPQYATGDVCTWRAHWFKALHAAVSFDLRAFSAVRGVEVNDEKLTLLIEGGEEFAKYLDEFFMPVLRRFVTDMGCKSLIYKS